LSGTLTLCPGPLLPTNAEAREKALMQQLERPVYAGVRAELDTPALRQLIEQVAAAPHGLPLDLRSGQGLASQPATACSLGWLLKTGLITAAPAAPNRH
jgi:hypothetical protein